jgi:25S rRNA (cytosine2870-C5)-methyltransferase
MRMRETVKVLTNFKTLRDSERSRADYMEELKNDLCSTYDYNRSLIEVILDLFPPSEALEFIEANEN